MDFSVILLLLINVLLTIPGCTSVNLTVSSPALDDVVLSGDLVEICPNTTEVEFSCTAENVTELIWRRVRMNESEIFAFHIRSQPPFNTPDGYTVHLNNSTTVDQFLFAPITSILRIAKVSDLIGGMIECRVFNGTEGILINESLRVKLLDSPPRPQEIDISITGWESHTSMDIVNITLQWNDTFSSTYAITKYKVSISENFTSLTGDMCPSECHPNESCVCRGLLTSDGVNLTVSAVNCDNQEGPSTDITIKKCQIQNRLSNETQTPSQCGTNSGTAYRVHIPNGYVCYDGLTFGSVATFQCGEGYHLMGSSQLWCQLDGEWDGDLPTCKVYEQGSHTNGSETQEDNSNEASLDSSVIIAASVASIIVLLGIIFTLGTAVVCVVMMKNALRTQTHNTTISTISGTNRDENDNELHETASYNLVQSHVESTVGDLDIENTYSEREEPTLIYADVGNHTRTAVVQTYKPFDDDRVLYSDIQRHAELALVDQQHHSGLTTEQGVCQISTTEDLQSQPTHMGGSRAIIHQSNFSDEEHQFPPELPPRCY